jgi:hypothetical protein
MAKRQIAKQILGTVVAVLSGWLAAMIFLEATTLVELMQEPHYVVPDTLYVAPITITIIMSYFVIPVWLFVLIPLYLFVPPSSVLWRLPVCTTCGVLAGILIIAFWMPGVPGFGGLAVEAWWFYAFAAIVGGVTCFIGAITRPRFRSAA